MQTKHIIRIIKEYKGRQRLAREAPVKRIAPLLLAYIYQKYKNSLSKKVLL